MPRDSNSNFHAIILSRREIDSYSNPLITTPFIATILLTFFLLLLLFNSSSAASAELDEDPTWESSLDDRSYCVAWGDYDNDGDQDLAVGNNGPNHIYENEEGNLTAEPVWESQDTEDTTVTHEVMWGDIDENGWLDLVAVNGAWGAGFDVLYLNFGGSLSTTANWTTENSDHTAGMDLGDFDGDGDLDLATANYNGRECIYENVDGMFTTNPVWESYLNDDGTQDAVFLDVDGDDDLDLYFGCSATMDSTDSNADVMFLNDPDTWGTRRYGVFPDWRANNELWTTTVKAGDIDRDGDTDIIAANGYNNCNNVVMYQNTGTSLDRDYAWSIDISWPYACDLGDVNGDGWDDVAISSYNEKVYLVMNDEGILGTEIAWESTDTRQSYRCQWGDLNGDDFPELAVANYNTTSNPGNNVVYFNYVKKPIVSINYPGEGEMVSGRILISGDAEGTTEADVDRVNLSLDDGETWLTADDTGYWSYEWDTTTEENGDYTIMARAEAGNLFSDISMVNVTGKNTQENHPPELEVLAPIEEKELAENSFEIRWEAWDDDGDILTIDLFYDTDREVDNGVGCITDGLENTGSYEWDIGSVNDGEYFILVIADDDNGSETKVYADGSILIDHASENHLPSIDITSIEQLDDYTVEISWETVDDDEDDLTIDLYFDIDTDPDDGQFSIEGDLEDTGSYDWDISEMKDGTYYIYAVVSDGQGTAEDFSDNFTISLPKTLPDLVIESIHVSSSNPEPGDTVIISVLVKNRGTVKGEGTIEIWVNKTSVAIRDLGLNAGMEDTIVGFWIAVDGYYTVTALVTIEGDMNETNNLLSRSLNVISPIPVEEDDDNTEYYIIALPVFLIGVVVAVVIIRSALQKSTCPHCGDRTIFYEDYDDYYCSNCEDYVGEMER